MMQATAAPPALLTRAEEIASGFHVSPEHVTCISRHFVQQMKIGLGNNGATQLPAFVTRLPTGSEKGLFLAVDLGGTNCRVCSVDLHGDCTYTIKQSKCLIPKEVMVNDSHKPLFAFIAEQIKIFLGDNHGADWASASNGFHGAENDSLKLGFTFSFTYENNSLAKGTVLQWDKGWHIPDALGRDPCEMLQNAIDGLALPVKVVALINDSVGTLMARAYTSPGSSETLVGAIFGTGTNAAYAESLVNVGRLNDREEFQQHDPKSIMVINTEWGAFDEELSVLPSTKYDDLLEESCANPKTQLFEKRVSAFYLGELFRLAIVQLKEEELLKMKFADDSPAATPYGIDTFVLTLLAQKNENGFEKTDKEVSDILKVSSITPEEMDALHLVAAAILRRAGRLSGAAIAATLIQSGKILSVESPSSSVVSSRTSEPAFANEKIQDLSSTISPLTKGPPTPTHLVKRLFALLGFRNRKSRPAPPDVPKDNRDMSQPMIDIGVDGALYEFCSTFEESIWEALEYVPEIGPAACKMISIGLSKDGSGVGAALAAQSTV